MNGNYDSSNDTLAHQVRVRELISVLVDQLSDRALSHDQSKLKDAEKTVFDEYTPKLNACTYGSDEYKNYLAEMKVALEHHYRVNRHHPEYFNDGIKGMTLVDLVEMFCDWKAASERHADGDIHRSIDCSKERFGLGDVLAAILHNTADEVFK